VKIVFFAALAYAGIVVAFESLIGYLQPRSGDVLVITTYDAAGTARDRVVSRLEAGGRLYVAANHWPRAWYRRALANPNVQVTIDGQSNRARAVPVTGDEHARIDAEHALPLPFRILTGFPPRYFVRIEPEPAATPG
jgi:hypothetical protein